MLTKIRLLVFLFTFAAMGSAIGQKQQTDAPVLFMKAFFKWYKTKYDYLDHHIFLVAVDKGDKPDRIDPKETEKYLTVLKSSGYFSDNYINNYRNYLKKIDQTLLRTKQSDGPVDGLDFDQIVHSLEPEAILKNPDKIPLGLLKNNGDVIAVKLLFPLNPTNYLLYTLKQVNNKYQIDRIDLYSNGKIEN